MSLMQVLGALAIAGATTVQAQVAYEWKDVTPNVASASVYQVVPHPLDASRLLALGYFTFSTGGAYYPLIDSRDGGATWAPVPGEVPLGLFGLSPHAGSPETLYASVSGQFPGSLPFGPPPGQAAPGRVYRSDDFGSTWTLTAKAPADGMTFVPLGNDPAEVGRVFSRVTRIKSGFYIGERYLSSEGIGVSDDRGMTWRLAEGLDTKFVERLDAEAPVPAAPERMFAVTTDNAYVTRDSGATWSKLDLGPIWPVRAIRADPRRADVLYSIRQAWPGFEGDILRSDDGGSSWRQVFAYGNAYSIDPVRLIVDPERPNELWLLGLRDGVRHSSNGGSTWVNAGFNAMTGVSGSGEVILDSRMVVSDLVVSAAEPGIVYAIQAERLYRGQPSLRRDPVIAEFEYGGQYWTAVNPAEARFMSNRQEGGEVERTGRGFGAWRVDDAPAGALAACRFQGNPAKGQHSRFITLAGPECEAVKRSGAYVLEGEGEFFALPPGRGGCADGSLAVKRFFNGKADHNHRYVADAASAQEMRARGWIEEGIVLCARPLGANE